MEEKTTVFRRIVVLSSLFLGCALVGLASPPDLTNGGVPGDSVTINLGATGLRGWVYHVKADTSESRQILIDEVDAGSPADGTLAINDVILGADGTGGVPINFTSDARASLANAIADAEALDPSILQLIRWRAGTTSTVSITLETMGAYSATAPYNCPKSAKILEQGVDHFFNNESSGRYTFGAVALLAADDPAHPDHTARRARLETEARALIPTPEVRVQMMSDEQDTTGMITWSRGHSLIFLAEYYLITGDIEVLPAIEAYAVNIAKNQSLFGTVGHKYADKNLDGSNNGPMGGVYGVVNSAGMPCFLGVLLAKECGLTNPELDSAIESSSRFYAYYAGRGSPPYGEHEAFWQGHENNGKSGLAAVAFALQDNRINEGKFFAKMSTASCAEREKGHTGAFFNYLWAPLGAAVGGEESAAAHFSGIRTYLDMARNWDGGFDYDCLNGEGPNSGSEYNNFRMSTAALLTYALPLRKLHLTGRGHDSARWLDTVDVSEAQVADSYNAEPRSVAELVSDLGSWSPKVQRRAADELGTRSIDGSTLTVITNLAIDPAGTSRIGACLALGRINDSSTAPVRAATLAGLLTDSENHVRFIAAEAMRYLPTSAKMGEINTILTAAASTAQPLTPYDEEDPLHFAHARLAMLLFYSGNAYGPKGVLWNDLTGVDRNLLYPAIRAVAATPVGQARSTLGKTYKDNLNQADFEAVADAVVESVMVRAPADKMFSGGVRQSGIEALQKFGYAEGVPLAMIYMVNDERGSSYQSALGVLEDYAGRSTTVLPDPDVIGFCEALLTGSQAAAAQDVLDAIAADSNPMPLVPFKSIQSTTSGPTSLTLPSRWTTLQVAATDLAQGDSVFTWRKVHGAGEVTFTPNGTNESDQTIAFFDAIPGEYLFEVTMSDSRGLTEVVDSVAVTLYEPGGMLPPNLPPTADPQSLTLSQATTTPIALTATDPEGYALTYTVTSGPANGSLSGSAPNLLYTSDFGYTGLDAFTFDVMDSQGQFSSATVDITINSASGFGVAIYEPFDYPTGGLNGQGGSSEVGLTGTWTANNSAMIVTGSLGQGSLVTAGNSVGGLNGGSNNFGGARSIDASALAGNGLLADGATLWLSAVVGYDAGGNVTNSRLTLALANDQFDGGNYNYWIKNDGPQIGSGVGMILGRIGSSNGRTVAAEYRDLASGDGLNGNILGSWTGDGATYVSGTHGLIVAKITWGATVDTIELFQPGSDMILPENPISILTTNVDQSTFDTLTWARGDKVVLDEVRLGATYHSVLLGSVAMTADLDPPVPNPAGFSMLPSSSGSTSISMAAVTAYDPTGVEYYFTCTSGGGSDSGWQVGPTYTDSGVTPGVSYTYTVKVRDLSPAQNETNESPGASAMIATTAIVPNVTGMPQSAATSILSNAGFVLGSVIGANSATVPADDILNQNPVGGAVLLLGSTVDLVASLGVDQSLPTIASADIVDDQGGGSIAENTLVTYTLSFSEDMNEATVDASDVTNAGTAPITLGTITEMAPGVFTFEVTPTAAGTVQLQIPVGAILEDISGNLLTGLPVDDDEILTVFTPDNAAPAPSPMTFAASPVATSSEAITMTATVATDLSGVEYYFTETSGNPGGNDSGWQDSPIYNDDGLEPDTSYSYTVKARDKSDNLNEGGASVSQSATTEGLLITDGTWLTDGNGDWSNAINWFDSIVADGAGSTARFTLALSETRTVTLDSDRTIGSLIKDDTSSSNNPLVIGGSSMLTLDVLSGSPVITNSDPDFGAYFQVSLPMVGDDGLTTEGAGSVLITNSSTNYSGPTAINGGMLGLGSINLANIGGGTGRNITVADGSAIQRSWQLMNNEFLNRLVETTDEIGIFLTATGGSFNTNDMDFSSGGTGADLPNAFLSTWAGNGAKSQYDGTITPAGDNYRLGHPKQNGSLHIRPALADVGGNPRGLIIGGGAVIIGGENTFSGETVLREGRLFLGRQLCLQNSALNVGNGSDGNNGQFVCLNSGGGGLPEVEVTDQPTLGGLIGSRDLASIYSSSGQNNTARLAIGSVLGLILDVDDTKTHTYAGNARLSSGMFLTKTGLGTQVLSGANDYTGATNVNEGTLSLVSGSHASAITVGTGASLKFTLGSATTSTAALDLTNGTVRITGTPDGIADYLLMTASTIAGTPALDSPVAGYALSKQSSDTELWLVVDGGGMPEIAVEQGIDIPDGGSRDFGTVTIGSTNSLVFTILNTGTADLNLSGDPRIAVSGASAADFTVTAPPSPLVAAAGSTTFTVDFTPQGSGVRTAELTIVNDDSDETPFNLTVVGSGQAIYEAWAGGAGFEEDSNGDGIDNGMAFILGAADENIEATGLLPMVGTEPGFLTLTFERVNPIGTTVLSVDYGGDLTLSNSDVIPATSGTLPSGVEVVVTPGNPEQVVVKIPDGFASASNTLFARLSATAN